MKSIVCNIRQIQLLEYDMLKCVKEIFLKHIPVWYLGFGSVLGAVRHNGPIPWDLDTDICVPFEYLDLAYEVLKKELPSHYDVLWYDNPSHMRCGFPRVVMRNTSANSIIHIDLYPIIGLPDDTAAQKRIIRKSWTYYNLIAARHTKLNAFNPHRISGRCLLWRIRGCIYSSEMLTKKYRRYLSDTPFDASKTVYVPCDYLIFSDNNIEKRSVWGNPKYIPYNDDIFPVPEQTDEYLKHQYGDYMSFPSEKTRAAGLNTTLTLDNPAPQIIDLLCSQGYTRA